METLTVDTSIYWKWLGTNHKHVYEFDATLKRSVMDDKCNFQCRKLKEHNRIYRMYIF